MNTKLLGTALIAASSSMLVTGCGILETVELPQIRFDSNSYIVQPGDTLDSVASRYKVDPDSLITINSLELAKLIPGQRLLLLRDDDMATMAALASGGSRSVNVPVQATGAGQTVLMPNATTVTTTPTVIGTDIITTPTEEIIGVVDAGAVSTTVLGSDALLDDQPVFLPEPSLIGGQETASIDRPEGVETIIQTVNAGETAVLAEQLDVPTSGAVSMLDADVNTPVQRVTVNQRADGWNWPAIGTITREFDLKEINRQGLDIDPGAGAGVQAAADGEVVYSGRDLASYGNLVILRHENNYLSAYSKVSDIFVKENQKVRAGDLIAAVGNDQSGKTELHFEIRRNGEPVNPIDYLPAL